MSNQMPKNNNVTANIGLFYACYRLSLLGWNAMPTSRNARGIDILAYSDDGRRKITIQVKSLSKRSAVPLGKTLEHFIADFVVVCRCAANGNPECFVLTPSEVHGLAHQREKNGQRTKWLQIAAYESDSFREKLKERIGTGNAVGDPCSH